MREHVKSLASVEKWNRRRGGKTIFVRFARGEVRANRFSEEILVGYGSDPVVMNGGRGVPMGLSYSDPGDNRSYLIIAFDNDYTGPDLAEYMGGVAKRFRNIEESHTMEAFARGALEMCRIRNKR